MHRVHGVLEEDFFVMHVKHAGIKLCAREESQSVLHSMLCLVACSRCKVGDCLRGSCRCRRDGLGPGRARSGKLEEKGSERSVGEYNLCSPASAAAAPTRAAPHGALGPGTCGPSHALAARARLRRGRRRPPPRWRPCRQALGNAHRAPAIHDGGLRTTRASAVP